MTQRLVHWRNLAIFVMIIIRVFRFCRRGPIGVSGAPKPQGNNENRLFVGNMDPRVSEGCVLKIFRQFGVLKRCDYMWHSQGPKRGQPRY